MDVDVDDFQEMKQSVSEIKQEEVQDIFTEQEPITFATFKRRKSEQVIKTDDANETNMITGFAYSVIEQFQNGEQFNMVYA